MGNTRRGQQMKIFVSHTSSDKAICDRLVGALRGAGADVWYDEHNLGAGTLRPEIMRELAKRPVFIVVLSKAALRSKWVQDECEWAYNLYRRKSARLILPVTASAYDLNDFDHLLYLEALTRIEAPGNQPYPPAEMISQTLRILALTPAGERPVNTIPQPGETLADLLAQGRALNAQSKHAEALPFFELATSQSPRSAYAWYGLGDTLSNLDRKEEAANTYDRVIKLRPNDAEAWYCKGSALYGARHYAEALVALDRAVELDPTYAWAWSERGLALGKLDRAQEALQSNERALLLDPDDPDYWDNKGVALALLKRYKEAIAAFDKAHVLDSRHANSWSNKGLTLYRLHRDKDALAAYDQALALDPTMADAWGNKGLVLYAMKRYEDALVTLDRALVMNPGDTEWLYWKASALYDLKRYEQALELCDEMVRLEGTVAIHWSARAQCLDKLGRKEEAKESEAKARELSK